MYMIIAHMQLNLVLYELGNKHRLLLEINIFQFEFTDKL